MSVSKAIRRNRVAFNKIIEDKDILGLWALLEQACLHNANTMLVFHRRAFDHILQGNKESFDNYIERFEDAVETLVDYTATISEDKKRDKMMLGLDQGRYLQLFNDIMLRPPVPNYQDCKNIIAMDKAIKVTSGERTSFNKEAVAAAATQSKGEQYKKKSNFNKEETSNKLECKFCKKTGHATDFCYVLKNCEKEVLDLCTKYNENRNKTNSNKQKGTTHVVEATERAGVGFTMLSELYKQVRHKLESIELLLDTGYK